MTTSRLTVIHMARKVMPDTVAGTALRYGTGSLNIGDTRVGENPGWAYPNGPGGNGFHGGVGRAPDGSRVVPRSACVRTRSSTRRSCPTRKSFRSGASVGAVGIVQKAVTLDVTGPATPEAARFEGYATALKPGWEPFVVGQKPQDVHEQPSSPDAPTLHLVR